MGDRRALRDRAAGADLGVHRRPRQPVPADRRAGRTDDDQRRGDRRHRRRDRRRRRPRRGCRSSRCPTGRCSSSCRAATASPTSSSSSAVEITDGALPGYPQVEAIRAWIEREITYEYGTSSASTSAVETLQTRHGVCRDFAHLGIALCRCLDIPARMVVGYLHELDPMDLHAWFEAYVGGRWFTFDATQTAPQGQPRGGRLRAGRRRRRPRHPVRAAGDDHDGGARGTVVRRWHRGPTPNVGGDDLRHHDDTRVDRPARPSRARPTCASSCRRTLAAPSATCCTSATCASTTPSSASTTP